MPSVKEEHIEPIKQNPKLPIANIIMFQKIIRKGMFKRIEKIGIKIVKGIIKKNQNTKHKTTNNNNLSKINNKKNQNIK